ncbi:MAG: hypothetical protein WCF85_18900, partial [Rhodospirillaceae bacterium]
MPSFAAYGAMQQRPSRNAPSPALIARRQEQSALSKAYQAARAAWFDRVLGGPEGPRVRAMVAW